MPSPGLLNARRAEVRSEGQDANTCPEGPKEAVEA